MDERELSAIEARARAALDNVYVIEYTFGDGPRIDGIEDDVARLVAEVRRLREKYECPDLALDRLNISPALRASMVRTYEASGELGAEVRRLHQLERDMAALFKKYPGLGWSGRGDNYPPIDIWDSLRRLQDAIKQAELEGRG